MLIFTPFATMNFDRHGKSYFDQVTITKAKQFSLGAVANATQSRYAKSAGFENQIAVTINPQETDRHVYT